MTIETEKLRALLAAATPGPWRKWAQHESTRCVWKDTLPPGSTCIESTGTVFALGVAVAATPDDGPDAALIAAAVNALPDLLDALATAAQVSDRVQTIADEDFGPFPTEPADTCLTYIEQGIFGLRQALATAEADRLTLARALIDADPPTARFAEDCDLAARIMAEADAEVRRG